MFVQIENKVDLQSRIDKGGKDLIILEFYAPWCGSCKMVESKVSDLAKEHATVPFLQINVDEIEELAEEYEVTAMPTFIFIKNKEVLATFAGTKLDKVIEAIVKFKQWGSQ